jgi:hypothetical protein
MLAVGVRQQMDYVRELVVVGEQEAEWGRDWPRPRSTLQVFHASRYLLVKIEVGIRKVREQGHEEEGSR